MQIKQNVVCSWRYGGYFHNIKKRGNAVGFSKAGMKKYKIFQNL